MTTCLGKSCSFGLLCVSFVGICQIFVCHSFHFGIEGRMWVVIVLIPDHCLSIYFSKMKLKQTILLSNTFLIITQSCNGLCVINVLK